MNNAFASYAAEEVLRDGGSILIRAIRPDDKQRLVEHFHRLSPRSVHFRFFGSKRRLTDDELRRFTELDFARNVGLVATLREAEGECIIGVGRYMGTAEQRAEVAFVVADEHQGRGIGTALLAHLAPIARANGVVEFEADVLGENNQMLLVFRKSGFLVKRSIESGVVHLSFPIEKTEELARVSLERDMHASAESVRRILEPDSVAVIGPVGEGSVGRAVLDHLRAGFAGDVYAVATGAPEIEGVSVFASLSAIGKAVTLAVTALPADALEGAVLDCARSGVRAIVALSSGSAAGGGSSHPDPGSLARLVRQSGMRLVGPESLGVINTDAKVRLNATSADTQPLAGGVGLLVQSGALGLALLDYAQGRGLGLSSFASVGEKADVSGNDLLSYWADDERTTAVALYLESFGNPRRFARIAPRVAMRKPVVALKSGGSPADAKLLELGARADSATDALFEQAGVVRAETTAELFGALDMFASQPVPAGPRVALIANSSGPAALFADACAGGPLRLAGEPTLLDVQAAGLLYERAVRITAADEDVDSVVVIHIAAPGTDTDDIAAAIARGAGAIPAGKPILTVFMARHGAPEVLHTGPRGRLPTYEFPENAARALTAAVSYGLWRARPHGAELELDRMAVSAVRAVVERVRGGAPRWLDARDFATLLRAAGIRLAESYDVPPDEAADLAETIGYPLVAKAIAPDLTGRADAGCVLLGLGTREAVVSAVDSLRRRTAALGASLQGVSLQRELSGGIEAIVAVTTDPLFGPLVTCGLGGVLVQLVRDVAVRLTPVTDVDAAEMLSGLRASRLLDGYRGVGPGDRTALESILLRVSALLEAAPEITALELDPIKVLAPGEGAVAVGGRVCI